MDGLPPPGRRYWIREQGAEGSIVNIGEEMGQLAKEVEIAQLALSDLGCGKHTCMPHTKA
jgi:hypothetical protein